MSSISKNLIEISSFFSEFYMPKIIYIFDTPIQK